ncbi:nodulin MtN21/EamA-like transporter family protein [Senna tora]|uniref:Nodulin MtN21/EamA-like transporter family protein n=1 Tax=Senna tora TaxID=362788 RepID=A0A834T3X8_9FABA|nr:nodulin MtN21/EamA-like transporter family protein [Senna tora]
MASPEHNDGDHIVELIERDTSDSALNAHADDDTVSEAASPLLAHSERPKINIFTVSYPRTKSRDEVTRLLESETSPLTRFILWVWSGSKYSGLLCMVLSSTIYFLMGVLSNMFSVQVIPLFEVAFTRCTVMLILSYLWLGRSEQPLFGTSYIRNILISRAFVGCLSLSSFVYCVQRLPFSQAILLNLTTPIMASIMARIFLHEKLKIADIAGLACSFFGVIFFFHDMLATQGQLVKAEETSNANAKRSHIFAILLGLFSSITGGTSYCLIRAGAKASDQPLKKDKSYPLPLYSFSSLLAFLLSVRTHTQMKALYYGLIILFKNFLQVLLARGLQLERIGKVVNVLYLEVELSQLWSLALLRVSPSFGQVVGCLLIIVSVFSTMYIGPDKEEME